MPDNSPNADVTSRDDPVSAEIVDDAEDAAANAADIKSVEVVVPADNQSQPAMPSIAPAPPDYRAKQSAIGGVVGSIVLGVIGLAGSFFTAASLFVSLTGLLLGIWGLSSERKWIAAIGIVVCVVAALIGGFQVITWLYQNFEQPDNEAPYEFEPIEESRADDDVQRATCASYSRRFAA